MVRFTLLSNSHAAVASLQLMFAHAHNAQQDDLNLTGSMDPSSSSFFPIPSSSSQGSSQSDHPPHPCQSPSQQNHFLYSDNQASESHSCSHMPMHSRDFRTASSDRSTIACNNSIMTFLMEPGPTGEAKHTGCLIGMRSSTHYLTLFDPRISHFSACMNTQYK
jgi:hypothetical protein